MMAVGAAYRIAADQSAGRASGQVAAAPPSAARNSRRSMVTVIRPSRARCVKGTIARRERAVLTARHPARRSQAWTTNPLCRGRAHGARITASGRLRARLGLRDGWHRIRISGVTEYSAGIASDHSALMPADLITFAHFSVSAAMCLPNSVGGPPNGVAPRSASRACILASDRAALIALLRVSITSAGVLLGAQKPPQKLAS